MISSFKQSQTCKLIESILERIETEYKELISTSSVAGNHREQYLKNLYSRLSNIKGNLNTLSLDENSWKHGSNKSQLFDNLINMFLMLHNSDPWINDCLDVIKKNLDWGRVNLGGITNSNYRTPTWTERYRKILQACNYTDDELIAIVHQYPHISILYSGQNSIIHSIGAIMK